MKKSELIAKLNEIEGDPDVMLSIDPEGNGFSSAAEVELSGSVDGEPCHPDDADPAAEKIIVIWP